MKQNGPNPEPGKRRAKVTPSKPVRDDWIIYQTITSQKILPVCCTCGKIRDPNGEWREVEKHALDNFTGDMTHTYCPECIKRHFPEYGKRIDPERNQTVGPE